MWNPARTFLLALLATSQLAPSLAIPVPSSAYLASTGSGLITTNDDTDVSNGHKGQSVRSAATRLQLESLQSADMQLFLRPLDPAPGHAHSYLRRRWVDASDDASFAEDDTEQQQPSNYDPAQSEDGPPLHETLLQGITIFKNIGKTITRYKADEVGKVPSVKEDQRLSDEYYRSLDKALRSPELNLSPKDMATVIESTSMTAAQRNGLIRAIDANRAFSPPEANMLMNAVDRAPKSSSNGNSKLHSKRGQLGPERMIIHKPLYPSLAHGRHRHRKSSPFTIANGIAKSMKNHMLGKKGRPPTSTASVS